VYVSWRKYMDLKIHNLVVVVVVVVVGVAVVF